MLLIAIVILGIILGVYIGNSLTEGYSFDISSAIIMVLTGFLGFVISCLASVFIGCVVSANADIKYVNVKTENIYALKDGLGVNGNSFLGTGTIDSKLKVYYITKDEFNAIHIQSKDLGASASIVQDGEKFVVTKKPEYSNNVVRFLFDTPMSYDKYEFHIPEGSITTDIKIDLN